MVGRDRQEIYRTIWELADRLRGAVDAWEFKGYVLGFIFYRYVSEKFAEYINGIEKEAGNAGFDYSRERDEDWTQHKEVLTEEKGYFIYPSKLFGNIVERFENAEDRDNINKEIHDILMEIEGSSRNGLLSGLFSQMEFSDNKLGESGKKRGTKIINILRSVKQMELEWEDVSKIKIDLFGDAYEYLIGMYASNAGKKGGEYYTPQEVSEVLVKLVSQDNREIKKVYDPACGSGSLLLKFLKEERSKNAKFYGQEINLTTYNLCRMNMFLHNVNYSEFDIKWGDTLVDNKFSEDERFDAIVSNPPYSQSWDGEDNPALIIDKRFSKAGVLAPKNNSDMAFVMHSLHHLEEKGGVAAIVCFSGIFFRAGKEKKIREYLVENHFIDAIIQLPKNLFFGTGIETWILILKKTKTDGKIFFVDASEQFRKMRSRNLLMPEHQQWIVDVYNRREDMEGYARTVEKEEIREKDYNLSLNAYIIKKIEREAIDIEELNRKIKEDTEEVNRLRAEIDRLIGEL